MNRLKELRIKHDKTQREIAALLNVTPKAISFNKHRGFTRKKHIMFVKRWSTGKIKKP